MANTYELKLGLSDGTQITAGTFTVPGSEAQPDWNQSDPAAPDYVKNRTHWVEGGEVVLYEGEVTDQMTPVDFLMEEGRKYKAVFDGSYEYIATGKSGVVDGVPVVYIGNGSIINFGENTGETYIVASGVLNGTKNLLMAGAPGEGESLFSTGKLIIDTTTTHLLPGKFLPEGTPWVEENEAVEILPETVLDSTALPDGWEFVDEIGAYMATSNVLNVPLEVGKEYIVVFGGTEYRCTSLPGVYGGQVPFVGLGNISKFLGTGDTGEPFVFGDFSAVAEQTGMYAATGTDSGATSITIAIKQDMSIIQPIDIRCLPDGGFGHMGQTDNAVLIDQTITAQGDDSDGYYYYFLRPFDFKLKVGNNYRLIVNETEYESVATVEEHWLFGPVVAVGTEAGIPAIFMEFANPVQGVYSAVSSNNSIGATPFTFVLIGEGPSPVPIEERFMPQSVRDLLVLGIPKPKEEDNGKMLGVEGGMYTLKELESQIPAFTSADNGKVLGVADGALAWVFPKGCAETLICEGSVTIRDLETAYGGDMECGGPIEIGNTYRVEFGGEEYMLIAKEYTQSTPPSVYLGNITLDDHNAGAEDTGEIVFINYWDNSSTMLVLSDAAHLGAQTLKIWLREDG